MNTSLGLAPIKIKNLTILFALSIFLLSFYAILAPSKINPLVPTADAACVTGSVPTTYGVVTQTVNVATAGTYRVWSRIKAPNTTANSYYFRVDSGCNYNVGDSTSIPANTWTWVNYQDGSTTTPIDVTLTAGSHTLTYTGKEADVQLDKVMLLTDTSCVPTNLGDNCAVNDTTSPTVSITSPTNGSTVSGTVTINANATDTSGISKVEFLVDGVLKSTDTTSAYSYAWDTTTATNGSHTLQAKAYDTANNTATSTTVTVTVNNSDATAPNITAFTATPTSVTAGGTVALAATATDNVAVTKVEFYDGTTLLNSDTTSPYSYNWVTTGVSAGAHSVTAKAYDAANNTKTSSIVTVTVSAAADTTAPTVSVTAPTNGTSVAVGTAVNITATASDNVGVAKVEFLVDGALKSTDTSSPYAYSWATTGVAAGTHTIVAKAYDAANNSTSSTTVSITLTSPNTPGDVNGDGRVNALDLSALISHDGQNYPAADFNGDGTVGAADMAILLSKWTW
jgi:hypothetical protein